MIREAKREDLGALLELYLFLHEDCIPEMNSHLEETWERIRSTFYVRADSK